MNFVKAKLESWNQGSRNKSTASPAVLPAKAGIQKPFIFQDSGSRFLAKAGITPARPE
jgi:hypothetical protein